MLSLYSASIDMLKSANAREVLASFTGSERVWTDLGTALEFAAQRGWKQNFVVRQWHTIDADMVRTANIHPIVILVCNESVATVPPRLDLQTKTLICSKIAEYLTLLSHPMAIAQEFRGFVKGGVLTALSQYNHVLFSQRLFDARDRVAAALRRYFAERITPRIGTAFDAYVVDFAICGRLGASVTALDDDAHLSLDRMRVIELNPWAPTTDAGLFAWTSVDDARVLNGERPFEVRLAAENGYQSWSIISHQRYSEIFQSIMHISTADLKCNLV